MFLHPYYTPNEHNCTRKKSEMLLLQQRKSKNTIDTHIKLKLCSQSRHIRAGDFLFMLPLRPSQTQDIYDTASKQAS